MSIAAPIAERYFAERYKSLLLLLFAVQLLLFGAYTLSLPIGRSPAAVLPSSGMSLFVLFCAASAFLGGCLAAVVLPHATTASAAVCGIEQSVSSRTRLSVTTFSSRYFDQTFYTRFICDTNDTKTPNIITNDNII
eukprot:COSAG01_NODE_6909_length_3443_cov_13.005981_3_plen_136_part_00